MSAENTPAVPSVKLPKAIMLQKQRVEEIEKQQVQEQMQAKLEEHTPSGNQTPTPEVQPTPVITPEVKVEAQVLPVEDKENTADYWRHRFQTSRGMFEAEKTRLKAENADLRAEVAGVKDQLKEMDERVKAISRQAPTTIDINKYLSKDEIEAYGPDLMTAALRVAKQMAEETSERITDQEVDRRLGPVQQKLEKTERELQVKRDVAFWETLEQRVPDWVLINDDPKFHEWLSEKDPFTGFQRQNLLVQAQLAFDAVRVVAMFTAFKQSSPAPSITQTEQVRVVPDPVGQTAIVTQALPDVPSVTTEQIRRFYDECKLGRYKYRPQEKEAMERKIQAAARAGRVIRVERQ